MRFAYCAALLLALLALPSCSEKEQAWDSSTPEPTILDGGSMIVDIEGSSLYRASWDAGLLTDLSAELEGFAPDSFPLWGSQECILEIRFSLLETCEGECIEPEGCVTVTLLAPWHPEPLKQCGTELRFPVCLGWPCRGR